MCFILMQSHIPSRLTRIKLPVMSVHVNKEVKKVTTHTLQRMKAVGEKISMITAYDYSFARLFDEAGAAAHFGHGLRQQQRHEGAAKAENGTEHQQSTEVGIDALAP